MQCLSSRPLQCAAMLMLFLAGPAQAATFCVNTGSELNSAINTAEANGEDDLIKLEEDATFTSSSSFHFQSTEPRSIKFSGGHIVGCLIDTGGSSTIDGQNLRRALWVLSPNGDIVIEGITFTGGLSTNNGGGGLRAASTTGDIRIERNKFVFNRADDSIGAASIITDSGTLYVRGNLVFANSSPTIGGISLSQQSGNAYVVSNTITLNESDASFEPGGLRVSGGAHFQISNNIIWDNLPDDPGQFQSDFRSFSSHNRFWNDIGVVSSQSTAPGVVQGELSVDPQFEDCGFLCFSFELERSSPLVDAGQNLPPGELTESDLAGKPRLIGSAVDIGAYENDEIFEDAFD